MLMQMLKDTILKDKYDVVVVGAGIGGITAGALLAHKGLKVLVIEQHYLPGGVCTSIKRKDAAMDAGAALLFGWNHKESAHHFVMNVLEEDIDMIPHEAIYRMNFENGKSLTFWRDFERYFKELNEVFPGREAQFRGFYEECFQVFAALSKTPMPMSPDTMPALLGMKMLLSNPRAVMGMPKIMNTSTKSVLDKWIQDPLVEGLFDLLIASCYCTKLEETPMMLGAAILCNTHGADGGACYPAGSPQSLPNKLEKALEKKGGQILYRHMVDKILIKKNKAYGVRLADGTEILADRVVSDADIFHLYGKLIAPEHIKPERLKWATKFVPSLSAVVIYLSVDAKAIPPGTRNIEALVGNLEVLEKEKYFVYIPSIDDPSICPEGVHAISVLCSSGDFKWPRPGDPFYRSEEYYAQKQKYANQVLDVLEKKMFPNLRQYIRSLDVATPSTIERFTLKSYGNIGGPKQMLGQHLSKRLHARSEFKNVYCVGDSTYMGEGVISATTSAVGAANMILSDLGLKQYLPMTFKKSYVHLVEGKPRAPLPPLDALLSEVGAKRLAIECQWCEDPKCMKNCPAGVDVPNFMRRIEAGNFLGAAQTIREMNPLGEICGLICPAQKLCQVKCNRLDFSDHPTRIPQLQAWVCQQAGKNGYPNHTLKANGHKVAVIGAGPAGLSCAYFLGRLGYSVDIYEKKDKKGGMLTHVIPSFRLPEDCIARDLDGMVLPTLNFIYGKTLGKDILVKQLASQYGAVFMAPGLWAGIVLRLPGIEQVKVIDALSFVQVFRATGKVDAAGRVLIIGGGSVAADAAAVAKRAGAQKILVACLERENEMPCLPEEREEMKRSGIEIFDAWGPKEFTSANTLKLVRCTKVCDGERKFCPEFDESQIKELEFDQIIMAVGQGLEGDLASYLQKEFGTTKIRVNSETQLVDGFTNLFAGGDLIRGAGTVVQAVADGRRAARAISMQISRK